MIIHPACQFDFSEIRTDLDFRCKQCGGKYQSYTKNCPKYNEELSKYLEKKYD